MSENNTAKVYVTDQELLSNGRTYNGGKCYWEHTAVGISKVLGWVFVYEYDELTDRDSYADLDPASVVHVVDFNDIEEVEKSGLEAGWLIEDENGYGEVKIKWADWHGHDLFTQWVKQHAQPYTINLEIEEK